MENHQGLIKYPKTEATLSLPHSIEYRTIAPQQLSIADIWRTIEKRKGLILSFTLLVLCAVTAYIFLKTPMYEGVARLQIDPTRSTSLGLEDDKKEPSQTDVDGRIKTEIAIIQSNTVALQVMKSLKLYADPHFAGKDVMVEMADPREIVSDMRRHVSGHVG